MPRKAKPFKRVWPVGDIARVFNARKQKGRAPNAKKLKEAELASSHPGASPAEITAETGWPLRFTSDLAETPPPTEEEISILRGLDPERFWLYR